MEEVVAALNLTWTPEFLRAKNVCMLLMEYMWEMQERGLAFRFCSRKLLGIGVKDWKWTAGFLGRCGRHKGRCENLNPVKRF